MSVNEAVNRNSDLSEGKRPIWTLIVLWTFVILPFLAVIAAVPLSWGGGLNWTQVLIGGFFYLFTGIGVTVGFHRYFTHGAFKAKRWLRITLAVAGSMAVEGPIIQWVANHRRHHKYSDQEGDPHSPWRFGESAWGLTKGLLYAHVGWMGNRDQTNQVRFAKDLFDDKDINLINKLSLPFMVLSFILPALFGGLITGSWQGALAALLWAGIIRVGLLHHITWSINSVCHVYGERPFKTTKGDKAANFWPLAIFSFGESWHNSHHADPTCARHGVEKGQIDISARAIWLFEQFGWVSDVRWPKKERFEKLRFEPTKK